MRSLRTRRVLKTQSHPCHMGKLRQREVAHLGNEHTFPFLFLLSLSLPQPPTWTTSPVIPISESCPQNTESKPVFSVTGSCRVRQKPLAGSMQGPSVPLPICMAAPPTLAVGASPHRLHIRSPCWALKKVTVPGLHPQRL